MPKANADYWRGNAPATGRATSGRSPTIRLWAGAHLAVRAEGRAAFAARLSEAFIPMMIALIFNASRRTQEKAAF
jgi:hypothetical protein